MTHCGPFKPYPLCELFLTKNLTLLYWFKPDTSLKLSTFKANTIIYWYRRGKVFWADIQHYVGFQRLKKIQINAYLLKTVTLTQEKDIQACSL